MKRKVLSLLFCMLLVVSIMLPTAAAADSGTGAGSSSVETVNFTDAAPFGEPVTGVKNRTMRSASTKEETDNGIELAKTAEENDDGTYTINLEAYATGKKIITEVTEDVPTDIVLVLDQSGSMAENMNTVEVSYEAYGRRTNSQNYNDQENLWYKLENGRYVSVSVTRQRELNYREISGEDNRYYYNNQSSIYQKVGDTYERVTVTKSRRNNYTYDLPDDGENITVNGDSSIPDFGDRGPLYLAEEGNYTYTYTYTLDGNTVTIGSSQGNNSICEYEFYQKKTNTIATMSRLQALTNALNSFVGDVKEKAAGADGDINTTEDNVNHRIAVVGFATGSRSQEDYPAYENTELFIGSTQYNYNDNASEYYSSAFQDMNTTAGQTNVSRSISSLAARGATYTDLGIEMANGILNANPVSAGEKRNRVVIVFTDGQPGYSGYEDSVAEDAISEADKAKNAGATVYSVGIFDGADATSAGNENGNNTAKSNWFMQKVSSNNGTPKNPSYYLSASDADALNEIFKQISDNIEQGGSASTLTEEAVIKDIISDQFELPAGAVADDIKLYTADYTGENQWAAPVLFNKGNVTIEENNVFVSGFNYSENWCGTETDAAENTTYRGKKLIIKFTVTRDPDFIGGNEVPTNGAESGIYDKKDGTSVETFPIPTVDVPIIYRYTTSDQEIFLGEAADLDKRIDIPGVDGIKNAFVDIVYKLTDPDGNLVGTYTILAGSSDGTYNWEAGMPNPMLEKTTEYQVVCTVTPVKEGTVQPKDFSKSFTVSVISGSLTINKQGGDSDERYVFNIQKDGEYYMTVTAEGGSSVTVTRLPKGTYTVEEETGWSWRYEPSFEGENSAEINLENSTAIMTCKNIKEKTKWLNGYSEAINEYTTKTAEGGTN